VESRLRVLVAYTHCVPTIDAGTLKTLYIREALSILINNYGPSKLLFFSCSFGQIFLVLEISVHYYIVCIMILYNITT